MVTIETAHILLCPQTVSKPKRKKIKLLTTMFCVVSRQAPRVSRLNWHSNSNLALFPIGRMGLVESHTFPQPRDNKLSLVHNCVIMSENHRTLRQPAVDLFSLVEDDDDDKDDADYEEEFPDTFDSDDEELDEQLKGKGKCELCCLFCCCLSKWQL